MNDKGNDHVVSSVCQGKNSDDSRCEWSAMDGGKGYCAMHDLAKQLGDAILRVEDEHRGSYDKALKGSLLHLAARLRVIADGHARGSVAQADLLGLVQDTALAAGVVPQDQVWTIRTEEQEARINAARTLAGRIRTALSMPMVEDVVIVRYDDLPMEAVVDFVEKHQAAAAAADRPARRRAGGLPQVRRKR